jgi:hypothetical protein
MYPLSLKLGVALDRLHDLRMAMPGDAAEIIISMLPPVESLMETHEEFFKLAQEHGQQEPKPGPVRMTEQQVGIACMVLILADLAIGDALAKSTDEGLELQQRGYQELAFGLWDELEMSQELQSPVYPEDDEDSEL